MSMFNHKFMNQNNSTYYKIFIGLCLFILGAILTGIATLIRDWWRLRKEKLSTAYAFKGEIETILEIVKKRQYVELLDNLIKDKKTKLDELIRQGNNKSLTDLERNLRKAKILKLLSSLTFQVNRDVFFVKNTLKDKIGLLGEAAKNIVLFYGYCNAFILDIKENVENNKKYHQLITQGNIPYNIDIVVKGIIGRDEEILKIAEEIIKSGDESIKELNKFISKLCWLC